MSPRVHHRIPAWVLIIFACALTARAADTPTTKDTSKTPAPIRVVVADGQLMSHPVRIFVEHRITPSMQPRLQLLTSHSLLAPKTNERDERAPLLIAPDQQEIVEIAGVKTSLTGTILVFDLNDYPVHKWKASIRLDPVVRWTEPVNGQDTEITAIGSTICLGRMPPAILYSVLIVLILVLIIAALARRARQHAVCLLVGDDNRLSLSRFQIAVWTVVIGTMILMFGMIRLALPAIPDSLVMLMGLSAITAGLGYIGGQQDPKKTADNAQAVAQPPAAAPPLVAAAPPLADPANPQPIQPVPAGNTIPPTPPPADQPKWNDLITDPKTGDVSISRAQLLFWTAITVILFVSKSILGGVLWDVPTQLVLLMGISQASYVAPKLTRDKV